MKVIFTTFSQFTKFGITIFVVLSAIAGYATGFQSEEGFSFFHFFQTVLGVFLLSSGSLALNQTQEYKLDALMKRTATRPVAAGLIKPKTAFAIAMLLLILGQFFLIRSSLLAGIFGFLTVVLYNGIYTYWWKPHWIYAAVPGAIPGALPVTIGYAAINSDVFSAESIYLFLILFLWQMPHFWALAIKFKDDYKEGGIPTLPVALGMQRTIYQMGLYTLAYVGCALASPMFYKSSWFYILLIIPVSFKILMEFQKFQKSNGQEGWLRFFMWINVSVLIFQFVPVLDKWSFLFINSN